MLYLCVGKFSIVKQKQISTYMCLNIYTHTHIHREINFKVLQFRDCGHIFFQYCTDYRTVPGSR